MEGCEDLEQLRGLEGEAAQRYFDRFNTLILQQNDAFVFTCRSRRPPLDNVNALLSFAYSLLASDCAAALEGAGLDPYVGFLHRARPRAAQPALDLMEELRTVLADRFVLSCINQKVLNAKHFEKQENGAVLLTEEGRRAFPERMAAEKARSHHPPVFEGKALLGACALCAGVAAGAHPAGRFRGLPSVFLEMRGVIMLVLITYDVNTETSAGRKRLRKVAKKCVDHGQRVQNSVFECLLNASQYAVLKAELTALIDPALDSLRFYQLGNNYQTKVEHVGLHPEFAQDSVLIF